MFNSEYVAHNNYKFHSTINHVKTEKDDFYSTNILVVSYSKNISNIAQKWIFEKLIIKMLFPGSWLNILSKYPGEHSWNLVL